MGLAAINVLLTPAAGSCPIAGPAVPQSAHSETRRMGAFRVQVSALRQASSQGQKKTDLAGEGCNWSELPSANEDWHERSRAAFELHSVLTQPDPAHLKHRKAKRKCQGTSFLKPDFMSYRFFTSASEEGSPTAWCCGADPLPNGCPLVVHLPTLLCNPECRPPFSCAGSHRGGGGRGCTDHAAEEDVHGESGPAATRPRGLL